MKNLHASLVATLILLSGCDSGTFKSGGAPDVPGPAAGTKQATIEEVAASQREVDALKPSMKDADATLRSMPETERKATVAQLKCLARQAVEQGMRPRPRTAELVAEARALAAGSPDGSCARAATSRSVMVPASSKTGVRPTISEGPAQKAGPAESGKGEKE